MRTATVVHRHGQMLEMGSCDALVLNQAAHFDLASVVELACQAAPRVIARDTLDYPDMIVSQLRFASGAIAQVWNCMTDPLMGYDGVVTGTDGTGWFDVYNARVRWRRFGGDVEERIWTPPDRWAPWAWRWRPAWTAGGPGSTTRRSRATWPAPPPSPTTSTTATGPWTGRATARSCCE